MRESVASVEKSFVASGNAMSRIGKQPIPLPSDVTVSADGQRVTVRGPKGSLELVLHPHIKLTVDGSTMTLSIFPEKENAKGAKAVWGLSRALLANLVQGVTNGFVRQLELQGVGYRAELKGKTLVLAVGFSHSVEIEMPEGITFAVEKNIISVSGIDKQRVGEIAAQIRRVRPPEPYQGKGIRYVGEYVRRKAGKVVGATSST